MAIFTSLPRLQQAALHLLPSSLRSWAVQVEKPNPITGPADGPAGPQPQRGRWHTAPPPHPLSITATLSNWVSSSAPISSSSLRHIHHHHQDASRWDTGQSVGVTWSAPPCTGFQFGWGVWCCLRLPDLPGSRTHAAPLSLMETHTRWPFANISSRHFAEFHKLISQQISN